MEQRNPLTGLGKRLRHLREQRGINGQDAAYAMGISIADLERIESGSIEEGSTYLAQLCRFSDLADISMSLLVEGEWTPADEGVLFLDHRQDAEEQAYRVLEKVDPPPTLREARGVIKLIRDKFEVYWSEHGRVAIAWRKPNGGSQAVGFCVDDIEVLQMLGQVRSRHSR